MPRMANQPHSIQFNIEEPASWEYFPSSRAIIRGWCFDVNKKAVTAIRLTIGRHTSFAQLRRERPDVLAAFSHAPDSQTGFELRTILPAGRNAAHIQAQLSDGSWHTLLEQECKVGNSLLPYDLISGSAAELLAFRMPAHAIHPPVNIRKEHFPAYRASSLPSLSIVTPSFQQSSFLAETIHSVLEESNVKCQYVVQDGGSSDGSEQLIRRYADRLHAWTSAPDKGQADAIAHGFAKTTGKPEDLMAWINSDDFYMPGALPFVVNYFGMHPEVDVIYGHRVLVDEKSREIGRWFLPRHDPRILRLNDFVPQETMFWRRRIWNRVGGIDSSFKFAMDWDLLLRFQAAGAKIIRVPYFLGCFRIHTAQKTSAQISTIGQKEIDALRERTFRRPISPEELLRNKTIEKYLRRSALIEFLWRTLGLRSR